MTETPSVRYLGQLRLEITTELEQTSETDDSINY